MYKIPGAGGFAGATAGGLALTGADVTWWIVAGVTAVAVGLLARHFSHRRRSVEN
ncbi:peptidase [Pseudonocardiaceae bacterium YIM PH 21723]|nr:peptidase [Pseudonocardiaceae bacterium YIM PH 21723]